MLVKFIQKESPTIFLQKEYLNVMPLLEMVKQKAKISIFVDDEELEGRLYDYEYTLTIEEGNHMESLVVIVETN
ncbi:hypothetical protein ABXS71_06220 [Bacillus infantis]|uniref:hypothetical protein n=1 Tax=Bacillus infantis TaxID=324767 RepID=UPI00344CD2ED